MSFVDEIGTGELVFEGLLKLDKKLKPVPAAAEKMDVSADGMKYTLTVRDGLKYSDGQPLTAKNFEYAWKRLFDPRVPNKQYSFVAYDIAGAEELDSTPVTDTAKIDEVMGKVGIKAHRRQTHRVHLEEQGRLLPLHPDPVDRLAQPPGPGGGGRREVDHRRRAASTTSATAPSS